jgi:hypothetical protein
MAVRAVVLGLILLHAIAKLMFNLFGRLLVASLHARMVNEAVFYEGAYPFGYFSRFPLSFLSLGYGVGGWFPVSTKGNKQWCCCTVWQRFSGYLDSQSLKVLRTVPSVAEDILCRCTA